MVGQKVNLFACKGNSGIEISEFFPCHFSGTLASLASPDPSHVSENIHFAHSSESPHASILGGTGELGAPLFKQHEFRGESETARIQN